MDGEPDVGKANIGSLDVRSDVSIADVYADGVVIQGGYAGFSLIFTRSVGDTVPPEAVVTVRMSPQQALVMTQLLRKVLRGYESDIGKIALPADLYTSLEIERDL